MSFQFPEKVVVQLITDERHYYGKVRASLLCDMDIASRISPYSYLGTGDKPWNERGYAFLEEDCDFSRFASAMKAAGREFQTIEVNEPRSDSWVRLLPSYEPDMIEPDMVSDEARSYGPQGRAA